MAGELKRNADGERLWWKAWVAGFGALSVGQAYFFLTEKDPAERMLNGVGGGMSTLGLLGLLVLPNPARSADEELRRYPERTREERAYKLNIAEEMLRDAEAAAFRQLDPLMVVLPFLVSTANATYVWVRYDAALPAARTLVGALGVNLAHHFTRPRANYRASKRYSGEPSYASVFTAPLITQDSLGIHFSGSF